jgi:hypothetical protein
MEKHETNGHGLEAHEASTNSTAGMISRRGFVERLRRTAIYAAPIVATISMMTPKAMGSP